MSGAQAPDGARAYVMQACVELPGSELVYPFGDDTAVYKVGGRIFALVSLDEQPGRLTVKAEPDYAASLVREHEAVTPGYHMNKRHWITVDLADGDLVPLLQTLVEDSFDLVSARRSGAGGRTGP